MANISAGKLKEIKGTKKRKTILSCFFKSFTFCKGNIEEMVKIIIYTFNKNLAEDNFLNVSGLELSENEGCDCFPVNTSLQDVGRLILEEHLFCHSQFVSFILSAFRIIQ